MTAIEARVEVTRLAALLRVDESALSFLDGQQSGALRELREQLTDRLFDANRDLLVSVAKLTKLVPGPVAAKIATVAFPPSLAARVAGVMESEAAVDLAKRLPVEFLADVAPSIDPRRVVDILAKLPSQLLVDAGEILGNRGEHISMADFVAVLPLEQVGRTLGVLSDEALVRTGLVIEDPAKVADIIGLLSSERLRSVVDVTHRLDIWDTLLRAHPHLSPETKARVSEAVAGVPDAPEALRA